jgi:Mg-chelatase subunit ChlD
MKKLLLILISAMFPLMLSAQSKALFDIQNTSRMGIDKVSLSNAVCEMTLMEGAYFTLGTTYGRSSLYGDNYNQLSFGHPLSLTSFPMVYADSCWFKAASLFSNYTQEVSKDGDTLTAFFTDSTRLEARFQLVQQNSGNSIMVIFTLKNIDVTSHTLGTGLTYDPALGNNGDGYASLPSGLLSRDTILTAGVPSTFEIWERDQSPKGLGLQFSYSTGAPDSLMFANWNEVQAGSISPSANLRLLYDLLVQSYWAPQIVAPGQSTGYVIMINILNPDFASLPFLRWNMPQSMSVEDSSLFPLESVTTGEVWNSTGSNVSSLKLSLLDLGMNTACTTASFTVNAGSMKTVDFTTVFREIYQDTVIEATVRIEQNGIVRDVLKRRVFIPAAPLSYDGIYVDIDSVSTANYPQIQVFFTAEDVNNGSLINDLQSYNVFPEEDNVPIGSFSLEKDTAGGVNQADIVIVLDVTGSMSDEIADVRDNIIEFADSLEMQGVDVMLGMVTFRDAVAGTYPLTSNVYSFQQSVAAQSATGGGDTPENSLDALYAGCQFSFRPEAKRIFIWITDAPYHIAPNINTNLTVNDVITELISHSVEVYAIAPSSLQTQWFDQIVLNTGGYFYDIYGNFRDVLLQISHMGGSTRYIMKYNSSAMLMQIHTVKVQLHYHGLGGYDQVSLNFLNSPSMISCYPNPTSQTVNLSLNNPDGKECVASIADQNGRVLLSYTLGHEDQINWSVDVSQLQPYGLNEGLFFFYVSLISPNEAPETEVVKVVLTR